VPGRLEGKVAIVTGGGGSIGTQHCLLLAREGALVVVNDIGVSLVGDDQPSSADRVVSLITEAGGHAVADTNSAASFAGAEAIVAHAMDEFGRVDVLVNNATFGFNNDIWRFTEGWTDLMAATMRGRGVRTKDDTLDPEMRAPAKISPFVVWLCTDAAKNVNGRTFHVLGDYVGLFSEPDGERTIYQRGGWDLDSLDQAGHQLTATLTNDYTLADQPNLQQFEL
jgi:hypothetical protein